MLPGEREIGGLRCSEVLERLGEYVDGELPPAVVDQVTAHVAGCDWCEQFGGMFARVVAGLRETLAGAAPLPEDQARRLAARLGLGD